MLPQEYIYNDGAGIGVYQCCYHAKQSTNSNRYAVTESAPTRAWHANVEAPKHADPTTAAQRI